VIHLNFIAAESIRESNNKIDFGNSITATVNEDYKTARDLT